MAAPTITLRSTSTSNTSGTRIGWGISGLVALFLLSDSIVKLIASESAKEATRDLGYPVDQLPILGSVLLAITLLYLVPRTAFFGALLLTGYLGGAAAIQTRLDDPFFLLPIAIGVLAWIGLTLRDSAFRSFVTGRR